MDRLNGNLGFAVIPDDQTRNKAVRIARKYAPLGCEFVVDDKFAHLTIYYTQMIAVPISQVSETIRQLMQYIGTSITLKKLEVFGQKFVFWNVLLPNRTLQSIHKNVIGVYKNFLEEEKDYNAKKEGLKLDPKQAENLCIYGHPLVLEQYQPHITEFFFSHGKFAERYEDEMHEAYIEEIVFARFGQYGKIEEIHLSTSMLPAQTAGTLLPTREKKKINGHNIKKSPGME